MDTIPSGNADFLLAVSGDAEFKSSERMFLFDNFQAIINEIPNPDIITKAVINLNPFSNIEILNLGFKLSDTKEMFANGMNFGESYDLKGNYLILDESSINSITTANTLFYALSSPNEDKTNFEKLSIVSNNTLVFCAGFLMTASRRFHIVLSGGIQMATCLYIADKLREDVLMRVKHNNITFAITSWRLNDDKSNIKNILNKLSYTPHAIYTKFSFADTEIPILKKYDEGEAKEGLGTGAALCYANTNNITNKELLEAIELIIYSM